VLVLSYRNPIELSQRIASADQLTAGRMTLGIGVGWLRGEFEALGTPPYTSRGAVTDEYLEVLRTLWECDGALSFSANGSGFPESTQNPNPCSVRFPYGSVARSSSASASGPLW